MKQYDKSETYAGRTISTKATTDTGTRESETGTIQTNTLIFYLDGVLQFSVEVTDDELPGIYAKSIEDIKNEIDEIDETDQLLLDLGFTPDTQVDPVMGFAATQLSGPGSSVKLNWDNSQPVDDYVIQQAQQSDFSDAQVVTDDNMPFNIGVLPPGMYYFRIKAQITGLTDSPWSTTSLNVL